MEQYELKKELVNQIQLFELGKRLIGISVDDEQMEKFKRYLGLLLLWNQRANLFSKRDASRLAERHLIESLAWIPSYREKLISPMLDAGSGAGFPGMPIAICYPEFELVLVESKQKKAKFLVEATHQLNLKASVFAIRIEDLANYPTHRLRYRTIFARAVASLQTLVKWTEHLMAQNACIITFKGDSLQKELEEFQSYNNKHSYDLEVLTYTVPVNLQNNPTIEERKLVSITLHERNVAVGQ